MQDDEATSFSPRGNTMIFRETCRIIRLLFIAALGSVLIYSASAQKQSSSIQSAEALAKNLKPDGLRQTIVRIQPIQLNDLARSLSKHQRAMMSSPPLRIVSALTDAKLPVTSPERFSLPAISKANFLAPTRVRPTDWLRFNRLIVNASELRSGKHPNVGLPE